jgi:alkanesulfonate monooxygenase SsuD/methylene tetrahydromethanopterin reductase-like flavin-dependent oxidoreductase (luciferase family)
VLGGTVAEAQQKADQLEELIVPDYGLRQLADILEVPIESLELDEQLPADIPDSDTVESFQSRSKLVVSLARREHLTVRQLLGRLGGGRGHWTLVGTPEQVADALQVWFEGGAADGFNVMGPVLPSGLEDFVDNVVPILRRRGLFRSDYDGTTLRDHYGLARPANRFARAKATAA